LKKVILYLQTAKEHHLTKMRWDGRFDRKVRAWLRKLSSILIQATHSRKKGKNDVRIDQAIPRRGRRARKDLKYYLVEGHVVKSNRRTASNGLKKNLGHGGESPDVCSHPQKKVQALWVPAHWKEMGKTNGHAQNS